MIAAGAALHPRCVCGGSHGVKGFERGWRSAELEGSVYWYLVDVGSSKLLKGARRARISAQVLSWTVVRTQRTHERKKDYGREPWRARRTGHIVSDCEMRPRSGYTV